jgi:hypothetical protein
MPTDHIVALLVAQRDKLNAAIEALQGTASKPAAIETTSAPAKKRHTSALPLGSEWRKGKKALGGDQGWEVAISLR